MIGSFKPLPLDFSDTNHCNTVEVPQTPCDMHCFGQSVWCPKHCFCCIWWQFCRNSLHSIQVCFYCLFKMSSTGLWMYVNKLMSMQIRKCGWFAKCRSLRSIGDCLSKAFRIIMLGLIMYFKIPLRKTDFRKKSAYFLWFPLFRITFYWCMILAILSVADCRSVLG